MTLSTCCGYDPRSGSIFILVTGIILTLLSPFMVSLSNDYMIISNKRVALKFDVIPLCLIIISCIVHITTLYGVIKRKTAWLYSYLIYGGFVFILLGYLLVMIINETLKSHSLSKEVLLFQWFLNFSFVMFSYVGVHKYFTQLKLEKKRNTVGNNLNEQPTFGYAKLTVEC